MGAIEPEFGYWLAGFVDGEGSFQVVRRIKPRYNRPVFEINFSIRLRADDMAILEEIQRRTGVGDIRLCPSKVPTQAPTA